MPRWLPRRRALVYVSGVAEPVCAAGLRPSARSHLGSGSDAVADDPNGLAVRSLPGMRGSRGCRDERRCTRVTRPDTESLDSIVSSVRLALRVDSEGANSRRRLRCLSAVPTEILIVEHAARIA